MASLLQAKEPIHSQMGDVRWVDRAGILSSSSGLLIEKSQVKALWVRVWMLMEIRIRIDSINLLQIGLIDAIALLEGLSFAGPFFL